MPRWQDWARYRVKRQDVDLDLGSIVPLRFFQAFIICIWLVVSITGVSSDWFGWFANSAFNNFLANSYLVLVLGVIFGFFSFLVEFEWKHRRLRRRLEQTVNFPDASMEAFRMLNREQLDRWKVKCDSEQHQRN